MSQADSKHGDLQTDVVKRLRSAAGHLQGVAGMAKDGADCKSVLQQVLAVQAALREINRLVIRYHLGECLQQQLADLTKNPEASDRWVAEIVNLYELERRSLPHLECREH